MGKPGEAISKFVNHLHDRFGFSGASPGLPLQIRFGDDGAVQIMTLMHADYKPKR
jgi:hypothetical protein